MHTDAYLVAFSLGDIKMAYLYDDALNFIEIIDPESEAFLSYVNRASRETSLDDPMWFDILWDIEPEERKNAVVYKLEGTEPDEEEFNERDARIEEVMEENDDEQSPGYNG